MFNVINIYTFVVRICVLLSIFLLNACIVSENPGSYMNPRYPSATPYSQPYQPQSSYPTPATTSVVTPGSRYYSNPYEFPQPNYYQYYDTDRYYKPPSSYNGRVTADSR